MDANNVGHLRDEAEADEDRRKTEDGGDVDGKKGSGNEEVVDERWKCMG